MRKLTQQEVQIVTFINYEGVTSTSAIAHEVGVTTNQARAKMKELSSIGATKRHVYSASNCIKWMVNRGK